MVEVILVSVWMVVCGGVGDCCTNYGIWMVALMVLWMAVVMVW